MRGLVLKHSAGFLPMIQNNFKALDAHLVDPRRVVKKKNV